MAGRNDHINQMEVMETVFIPEVSGEDPCIYVGLNGKGYTIPRGKKTEVPKPVADILYASEAFKKAAKKYSEEQTELMNKTLRNPIC